MRKLMGLLVIVAALALMALPAAAVPTADLTALARFFDFDSVIFGAVRVDDGYIETLDGVLARVNALLPAEQQLPGTLADTLDIMFANFPGGAGTFNDITDPWLGDTIAFGIKSLDSLFDDSRGNDDEVPFMIAIASTDRAAAVDFWTNALDINDNNFNDYSVSDEGAFTLFTSANEFSGNPVIYIADDVVILSALPELLPSNSVLARSLADSPTFASAVAGLPGDDYNIFVYSDTPRLFDAVFTQMENQMATMGGMSGMGMTAETLEQSLAAIEAIGPQALAFTIVDGRSLTIDISQSADVEAMAAMSGVSMNVVTPFDPAFAGFIPANTPVVVQGANLGASIAGSLASFEMQADMMAASMGGDADDLLQVLAQIEFAVQGFTGLDLEDEILPWMDGDYALWLSVSPALGDISDDADITNLSVLPADGALLIETSNPELSAELVTGLTTAVNGFAGNSGVTVSTETIGGGSVLVVTLPAEGVNYPVEVLVGSNDTLLAIGTRSAVEFALNPDGATLADDPLYQESLVYALPNSIAYAYLAGSGLQPLAGMVAALEGDDDAAPVQFFIDLFHSSSISSIMTETGIAGRLVLTLP